MIKLKILRDGEGSVDFPGGSSVITGVRIRKKGEAEWSESEIRRYYTAGFEDGGSGHESRNQVASLN